MLSGQSGLSALLLARCRYGAELRESLTRMMNHFGGTMAFLPPCNLTARKPLMHSGKHLETREYPDAEQARIHQVERQHHHEPK
jgi:hypothetical protein